MTRPAFVADLGHSLLDTLGQTCLSGVVLNIAASLVCLYLWRRDEGERYLAFWSAGHLFTALRWIATYPAVTVDSMVGPGIVAASASVAIAFNLTGGYSLLGARRFSLTACFTSLVVLFVLCAAVGLRLQLVAVIFAALSLATWLVSAAIFWRARVDQPLSAYSIAAGAMLVNFTIWAAGLAMLGRGFVTSIIAPMTTLPTMMAFLVIAHQRALAKARDSEQTVNAVFDTVPIPILISSPPDGRLERINQRAIEVFGIRAADHIGRTGIESGVVADAAVRNQIYADLAAGRDVRNRESTYQTGAGKSLLMSVNASRLELREGTRYVFTLYDLTEIRKVEEALQDLNASLEQQVAERTRDLESFSYSVSHDLRAPLRAIDGYSAMLAEELGDSLSGPAARYLASIRENCRRMNELIEAMIALSQQGAQSLAPQLVDISALAEDLLREIRAGAPDRQVEVVIEPWLRATVDANAMRIILDNLLRNAWKYSAQSPRAVIGFGCDMRDGLRVFHVRDNGVGFDMAQAGDLFKPFVRLASAKGFEGTGIGLANVARVIRKLGGRIWAESRPGAGATFFFTLGPAEVSLRGARPSRS